MTQPYIGEIRLFGGNFAPMGWAMCDGQLIAIATNDTLYNLLGTTYGGDGVNTFGVPDLRGRVPSHMGTKNGMTYAIGQPGGTESVTLTPQQLPQHTHPMFASSATGTLNVPTATSLLSNQGPTGTGINAYTPYNASNPQVALSAASTTPVGGNQPHDNMQPYLGVNFIIALYGVYPSQN
ncbi:phage tail protein [Caulobacter soli]|uniref:phage tail protein n=1 Tax=Caulobacter soli TaxID=2708539 RepID=UPI0013EBCC8A|nr:tail fiber protein [Caulobacter soli]